jgi:hypothetical protein
MNNPHAIYLEQSRRVASLMAWLGQALERQEQHAAEVSNPGTLWLMIGSLAQVEMKLISAVTFVGGVHRDEVEESLNDEGQGND